MNKKIKLSILGFSFKQSQTNTYGLVCAEEKGLRRIMIIIGSPEAQAIAFKLHNAIPPRPMTHDLFQNLLVQLKAKMKEVIIYKYENGVFFSRLVIKHDTEIIEIESRTSDAVAIALRVKCNIYTTDHVMNNQSVLFAESDEDILFESSPTEIGYHDREISLQTEQLEMTLKEAVDCEDYELASILREEIAKKKNHLRHSNRE